MTDGGEGACFAGGDLEECRTSDSFERGGGDGERLESTCIRSSRSRSAGAAGEGAVDVGDSVAIGGSAIGPELLPCKDNPAPMGRGWGGRTTDKGGLEG